MDTILRDLNQVSFIDTFRNVGKREAQIPVILPEINSQTVHSFTVLDPDQNATFGFWYAGITIANSDNDTLLTVLLIPQANEQFLRVVTQVEKRVVEKLTIIKKLEAEGISIGALRLSKMEASIYFRQYKDETFSTTTVVTLHNKLGQKIKTLNAETTPIELQRTDIEGVANSIQTFQRHRSSAGITADVDLSLVVDTKEASGRNVFHIEGEASTSEVNILEQETVADSFREVSSEELEQIDAGNKRLPGIYIETAHQAGLSVLNILIIYNIDVEGNYHPILYNQCSNTVTESFSHKIKKKKKSGFFSSKIKIKHIVKMASEITTECGEIKTIEELEQQREVIPLTLVSERRNTRSRSARPNGFIENFKRALKRVQDFRDNPNLVSKFSQLDLGFYSFSVENRIQSPRRINQGPLNLCGPAAYLYLLAKNDPDGYAQVAIDLILNGKTSYNGLEFEAHPDMFNQVPMTYTIGNTTHVMDAADWLTMSSLRYAQNSAFWFTYNPAKELGAAAMTTHWEMTSWVEDINNVKEETISGSTGVSKINDALNSGKQILVLIDVNRFLSGVTKEESKAQAQGFEEKMASLFSPLFGNHYVVIDSNIQLLGSSQYRFTIWTWGNYTEVTVNKSDFDDAIKKTFVISKEN